MKQWLKEFFKWYIGWLFPDIRDALVAIIFLALATCVIAGPVILALELLNLWFLLLYIPIILIGQAIYFDTKRHEKKDDTPKEYHQDDIF